MTPVKKLLKIERVIDTTAGRMRDALLALIDGLFLEADTASLRRSRASAMARMAKLIERLQHALSYVPTLDLSQGRKAWCGCDEWHGDFCNVERRKPIKIKKLKGRKPRKIMGKAGGRS